MPRSKTGMLTFFRDAGIMRIINFRRASAFVFAGAVVCGISGPALAAEPPCPSASPEIVVLPATRAALAHGQPVTIVALGSSSTEGSGASAPDRTYPARLAALLRVAWPDSATTVLNKGVGGQTVDAVMERLDTDVIAAKPTLVIWQAGTNEALRAMDPARFASLLDAGVRRIVATGADVILMDTQLAPRVSEDRQPVYDGVLAKEAEQRQVSLFSRARLMREWRRNDPTASDLIGLDGLHHTDRGYACVAASLGEAITNAVAKGVPVAIAAKK
jgi:acyl-CoA thioesterase I